MTTETEDDGLAPGVTFSRSWPGDRWSAGFVPVKYPRPEELLFTDWSHEDIRRVTRLVAEIECAKHGHIICPAAEDGCCDGFKCYECENSFSRDEHIRLMREQNGRECHCPNRQERRRRERLPVL